MASILICNRTAGKSSRIRVDGVNLDGNVDTLRAQTSKAIDVPKHEIELIYAGRCMKDDDSLESYGLKSGCTIHVLKKRQADMQEQMPEKMDSTAIQQVVTALQTALINPAYRTTVERMLSNPETLENIIAATPGLEKDPVAIAMLQDPEILALLADPSNIHKVIEAHPSLGQAAMHVAAAVNEEGAQGSTSLQAALSGRGTFSLDQMSDDDELEVSSRPPGSGSQGGQGVTASQLAAALAAATGSSPAGRSAANSAATSSQSSESMISADFFRQAMMAAQGEAGSPSSETVTQSQLQQLRDMGITDEDTARRALQATGGDLQAALELIFGDGV